MTLQLTDLDLLETPAATPAGLPLQLDIDSIDEDASQPRLQFDDEPLQELAASIAERGVLQAISVRPHPQQRGRWILNFGARRLRASRLAGRPTIPAFVNETASSYDQFVENEQREGLKPLEVSLFVQQRLAGGESQADIARQMGKSRAYVTYATALIDAPDCLMTAYREGRCRGLHELYELRRLHDTAPRLVEDWMRSATVVSRTEVVALKEIVRRDALGQGAPRQQAASTPAGDEPACPPKAPAASVSTGQAMRSSQGSAPRTEHHGDRSPETPLQPPPVPTTRASLEASGITLWGAWEGTEVTVDLRDAPGQEGLVYVIRVADGQRLAIPARDLRLHRVVVVPPRHERAARRDALA